MGFIHLTEDFYQPIITVFRVALAMMKAVDIDGGDIHIGTTINDPLRQQTADASR